MASRTLRQRSRGVSLRGFTLIELLAVTAIIAIISALVLADNNRFGGRILLANYAYDIALTVREAQVYGIAVHRFGTTFQAGYGMHFDMSNPTSYVLFADANTKNGLWDCPGPGNPTTCETVQSYAITRGFQISDLCATAAQGGTETCGYSSLDVAFVRPEPDAYIAVNSTPTFNNGVVIPSSLYQRARIKLLSPRGDTMSVIIEDSGQITVSGS